MAIHLCIEKNPNVTFELFSNSLTKFSLKNVILSYALKETSPFTIRANYECIGPLYKALSLRHSLEGAMPLRRIKIIMQRAINITINMYG